MKLTHLFNAIKIQNDLHLTNGSSAIFEGTKSYTQHALNDMVEDHLPENTRVWKIQWVISEDGNDGYRPQFIFARTKDEAAHKFTERMRHPSLGLVAIESIIEVPFNSLIEGDVIQPFPDKMLWSKKARDAMKDKRTDAEKYNTALTGQQLQRMPDDKLDQTIQKQRQDLGFSMSDEEAQKYANDIINDIKNGLQKGSNIRAMYDNVSEWLFELLAGDLPYGDYDLVVKMMLAHPDFGKIQNTLKKKYNYDLVSNLTEGEVIPFPTKAQRMSDRTKYDMAAELQRIDKDSELRSIDLIIDADPTKEEMKYVIAKWLSGSEIDKLSYNTQIQYVETAIYWFASDFHRGQDSNLYKVQELSPYYPSDSDKIEDEDEITQDLYFTLYDYFSNINEGKKWMPKGWNLSGINNRDKYILSGLLITGNFVAAAYFYARLKYQINKSNKENLSVGNSPVLNIDEKKKKKKKKVKDAEGAWNKAEQYTKYDPPKTRNKGVSARRGFIGG